MRTAAITGLGILLATGSAWAQSSYDYRDRDDDRSYSRSYDSNRHQMRQSGWNDDDHHAKSRPGRGAAFYLKSGDKEFRVDCGDDDSTRECVDAAMTMFRQVQDTESRASSSAYPSTPGQSTTSAPSGSSASPSVSPGASGGANSTIGR